MTEAPLPSARAGQPRAGTGRAQRPLLPLDYWQRRQLFLVYLGVPAVLYILAVAGWPLVEGCYLSFFDYNLLRPAARSFIGLDNYRQLWADPSARRAVLNTYVFTASAVAVEFGLGLGLALLLWRDDRFNRVSLALMLVPVTLTPLAVGLVFRALLAADFGLIGYYGRVLHLSGERGFFGEPATAMGALVFIDVWEWTPLVALILLAGLKTLPSDVIEAAEVDGAGPFQRLRLIVMPMMLPAIFLALAVRTMDAFRIFDSVFVTTKGGPNDATNVLLFYAVKQGFEFFNVGFASAISNVMIVCIALFAALFAVLTRQVQGRVVG